MNKYLLLLLLFFNVVFAVEDIDHFSIPEQQKIYSELTQELRCLVCQNESLADSQSALAKDLRQQVALHVRQGKSKQTIIDYLTKRYGDFVLYKPPFQKNTYLLWLFPFVLLAIGAVILFIFLRRRN